MPFMPDLTDPRYLHEVGWFVYHEQYGPITLGSNFDEERHEFSGWLMFVFSLLTLFMFHQFMKVFGRSAEVSA